MDFIFSIILGLIEGVTEYLPISSTGHLLVGSEIMAFLAATVFNQPTFLSARDVRQTFDIVIQIGPIFALIVYFRRDLWELVRSIPSSQAAQRFALNILIAFVPSGIAGLLLGKLTENAPLIGAVLIVGGIVFILIEANPRPVTTTELYAITPLQALIIGLAQILALIPGVSRSGATIVAGLVIGIERSVITRFTFYLAIPTLIIATGYSLYKAARDKQLTSANIGLLLIGTAVAFIAAYAAIAWFLRYVSTHNFRNFGIYRIVIGGLILLLAVFTNVLTY